MNFGWQWCVDVNSSSVKKNVGDVDSHIGYAWWSNGMWEISLPSA